VWCRGRGTGDGVVVVGGAVDGGGGGGGGVLPNVRSSPSRFCLAWTRPSIISHVLFLYLFLKHPNRLGSVIAAQLPLLELGGWVGGCGGSEVEMRGCVREDHYQPWRHWWRPQGIQLHFRRDKNHPSCFSLLVEGIRCMPTGVRDTYLRVWGSHAGGLSTCSKSLMVNFVLF